MRRISNDTLLALVGLALVLAFTLGLYFGATVGPRIQEQFRAHRAAATEVGR